MGFSKKNYVKITEEFSEKRSAAQNAAAAQLAALHAGYPRLAQIDADLAATGFDAVSAVLEGADVKAKLSELEKKNLALRAERDGFLRENGLSPDAGNPVYDCAVCRDEGFVDGKMCDCMRARLVEETFASSGIGNLIRTQSFETFSKKYYENDPAALEAIEIILLLCRDFADNFDPASGRNLLFMGPTGLGKTHLSTAIAKVVIEKGCDVVYDTAQNVFFDFERAQFGKLSPDDEDPTPKYFECDLLIIDDLGTEMTNSFTVSCLYNIINTRINHNKPMIINTNLTQGELLKRYADRITSRLFGDFSPLVFRGKDIRSAKLFGE